MVIMGKFVSNLYDKIPAKTQTPNAPLPNTPFRMHRSQHIPNNFLTYQQRHLSRLSKLPSPISKRRLSRLLAANTHRQPANTLPLTHQQPTPP